MPYRGIEGVPTDYLVGVRGRVHARTDERIDALDDELGACESQQPTHIDILSDDIWSKQRRDDKR